MAEDEYDAIDQRIFEVLIEYFPSASINDQAWGAAAVRRALADAGLLVTPGGETIVQYAVRWPSNWVQRFPDPATAQAKIDAHREWADGDPRVHDGVVVQRRTIRWRDAGKLSALYTGPWQPVTTEATGERAQ